MNQLLDFLSELLATNIWPLVTIFFGLLVLKQIKDDVRPIFRGMVDPLTRQAQTNASMWALAIMLAVLSTLQEVREIADTMHWVYLGFACKICAAPLALLVGLIKQSQGLPPTPRTGMTTAPFAPPPPASL